jgi:hypothetical protein
MLNKILSIALCLGLMHTNEGMATLPAGFETDAYLELHQDLQAATATMFSWDKRIWARDHYLNSGVNEGRHFLKKPTGFHAIVYINLYADLVAGTATMTAPQKIKWAQEHYYSHGKHENRNYLPMPAGFDPLGYLNLNADLLRASNSMRFQTEKREFAQYHYTHHGRAEGRLYIHNPAGFNVDSYLSQGLNPDLAAVVHANPAERASWAQQHYIANGIAEGRQYLNRPVGFNPLAYINLHDNLIRETRTMTNAEKVRYAQNHYMTTGRAAGMRYLDVPAGFYYYGYLRGNNILHLTRAMSIEEQREFAQHHYITIGRLEEQRQAREQLERLEADRVAREQEEQRLRAEQAARDVLDRARFDQDNLGALDTIQLDRVIRDSLGQALPEKLLWDLVPQDSNFFPTIGGYRKTPLVCCAKFMNDFQGLNTLAGLTAVERLVLQKITYYNQVIAAADRDIATAQGQARNTLQSSKGNVVAKKMFWEKHFNNIADLRQNWDTFVPAFLTDLTEVCSLPYLKRHFGNTMWMNDRNVDITQTTGARISKYIYEFLYRFSTLTPEQQAYNLLEWKYNILPSIRETCEWIQEIHLEDADTGKESYVRLMNEVVNGYADPYANNVYNVCMRINAFREPVVRARKHLLPYLNMLLAYKQDFTSLLANNNDLIGMNLVKEHNRFNAIVVNYDGGGFTYLHPEYCAASWIESYNPVSVIQAQRNFTLNFLDTYKAFRDVAKLDRFYTDVLNRGGNCLNARSAALTDARMETLAELARARQALGVRVLRNGTVNQNTNKFIVEEVLDALIGNRLVQGLEDLHAADNEDDLPENLVDRLTNFFQIGQANTVRGTNGEVTIPIIKEEMRRMITKYSAWNSRFTDDVRNWAQQP